MRYRRATSLVELLVVMSACSVILTLSAALLHRAMHIQSRSRSYFDAERSATRLSQQFRGDVHNAVAHRVRGMDLGDEVLVQLMQPDDELVTYSIVDGTISRNLMRGGAIVSREEYSFPPAVTAEIRQEDEPTRLVLTIATESEKLPNRSNKKPLELGLPPMSLHAEAVTGRDLRFTGVSASRETSP